MTVIAIVPALVCILGVLVYALAEGKASELGRLAFFAGLFVTLIVFASHVVRIGAP